MASTCRQISMIISSHLFLSMFCNTFSPTNIIKPKRNKNRKWKKKTFITELFRHLWQQLLDLPYFPALTDTGLGDGRLNGSMNSGKIGGVHPIFDMFRTHDSMLYIVQSKRHFRESIYALQAWRLGFVSANQSWRLQYTSLTYRIIRYLYKSIQVLQVFSK